jgi:hydrogenase-4 component B
MSGVMIKTAIYGIIRFMMFVLGVDNIWWGHIILALASISCLVGIVYALIENDLKKLLAYSSVENIGIILFGVGASMIFISLKMPYLAAFALAAGLYHLVNHAIFKGLLFLCAGSVYHATGTRDMEKMGGLIRRMPWTSACFLIGSMAISAIPPFNGFMSEWLTLQVFFQGAFQVSSAGLKLFFGLNAAVLVLTGGLAATCFVKAFGITFLAMPRSVGAETAQEVPRTMKIGMSILCVLALAFGVGAGLIMKLLMRVAEAVLGTSGGSASSVFSGFTINSPAGQSISLSIPLLVFFILIFGILGVVIYGLKGKPKVSRSKTWDCGYYKLEARNEYTATAFSKPFRIVFSFFLLPYRTMQKVRESFYHVKSLKYETHTTPVFKKYIYKPMLGFALQIARLMRRIQPGSIHLYIGYIFITLIVLILLKGKF